MCDKKRYSTILNGDVFSLAWVD